MTPTPDPIPNLAPASAAEVLLDMLTRLQQATRAYRVSSTVDALDAQDIVNEVEMELGELLCPIDGRPDFDLAALAQPQPADAAPAPTYADYALRALRNQAQADADHLRWVLALAGDQATPGNEAERSLTLHQSYADRLSALLEKGGER